MQTTTEMQLVDIDRLIPYVNNARTHSPEQINKLRASLREFGFINPILVDKDFNVLAGHGRIAAAKAEGIERVPCVFVEHLTEAQKKAYILADNRMALDAGWDADLLRVEIEELQGMDFDVSSPALTKKRSQNCSTQAPRRSKMISTLTPSWRNRVFPRPATFGCSDAIV